MRLCRLLGRTLTLAVAPWVAASCRDGGLQPAVVIATPSALPHGTVGSAYDVALQASGGTGSFAWRVSAGALPLGLALSADGQLRGTPATAGVASFTVSVRSGSQSASSAFDLTVEEPPLAITTPSLSKATLGVSYSQFVDVEAGLGQPLWSVASGSLPPGLTLVATGQIAGTPTALGDFALRLRVTRGGRAGERGYVLAVVPPPLAITTAALPDAEIGLDYEAQLESSGGVGGNAWVLSSGRLPLGLVMSSGGLISGSPAAQETQTFAVRLTSGSQAVTRTFDLTVGPPSYVVADTVEMPADVFTPFFVKLLRGGTVTWRFPARAHNVIFIPAPGVPADINIVADVDVTRTFPSAGLFRYDCTIHPGMSGQVAVKP